MAGTWDVPGLLRTIPARLFEDWFEFYLDNPWDAPALMLSAWMKRGRKVSGDDPDGMEAALDRALGM